jgi:hypothetical protein
MLTHENDYLLSNSRYASNLLIQNSRTGRFDMQIEESWKEDEALKNFALNESDNGTVFQRPLFLQYHDRNKFTDTHPLTIRFFKRGKLVAYIAGAVQFTNGNKIFLSPFGSSYGGLVFHSNLSFKEIEEMYYLLLDHLQSEYTHLKISSTPAFQSRTGKSQYIEHILLQKEFVISRSDIILVHQLDEEEKLLSRIDKKTFTELKQPLYKNKLRLEVIAGVDEASYRLLAECQEKLQSRPTHTFDELNRIETLLPGTVQTFKAIADDNFVAGIITFRLNQQVLSTFYVFDSPDGRCLKANHFTYYHVAANAFRDGFRYLDFGASSFGWLPNYPLISFKEKFDAKPFLRHCFEKQLL